MISRSQIEELRDKWQTDELNVAREYVQHVLLSGLYQGLRKQVRLAFKGGTALRILQGSPRFSEDLDFTGWGKAFHVGESLKEAIREADKAGIEVRLEESSPTSGGWFASATTKVHDWPVRIEWNISLRESQRGKTETTLITTPLWAAYSIQSLSIEAMVAEKIEALLFRAKPRDFYDLYFILRKSLGDRKRIASRRDAILKRLDKVDPKALYRELRIFLPKSHWPTMKDLPSQLKKELRRL